MGIQERYRGIQEELAQECVRAGRNPSEVALIDL